MEWKEVRLGDIVSIKSGLAYKGAFIGKGENILLGMGCVSFKDKFLFSGARPYEADCEDKYCVGPGDIVLATRQQSDNLPILAMPAIIPSSLKAKKIIYGTNLYKVENHSEVTNDFLFWQLKMPDYIDYISSVKTGSVVRMVTKKNIEDYVFRCPPKEVRDRISKLLWGLDRKIELNNKINADLEEMAQAIFKNWFVDFELFKDSKFVDSELGMIPEGWKVGRLGDFCKCLLGGTPSRSKEEYWNGDVNWINSGEINKFRILEASEKITELGLSKSATKLLPKKTTVLAITGATLGQVSLLEIDTCANQSVIGVLENTEIPYEYIYPFIKDRIEMLIQHQTGGAQQHINKDNVESLIFLLPAKNVLENYISLVGPMYKRIESQCFENLYLSSLRDTLLPRLMSGELEVPE